MNDDKHETTPEAGRAKIPVQRLVIQDFITELRKAAKCVFLATEEDIAHDLSGKLSKAARLLETLNAHGDALCVLINEWEAQGKFLNNPHDHPEDRAAGRTYTECADILRSRFSV